MKKLFTLFFLYCFLAVNAQDEEKKKNTFKFFDNIIKYSTIYASSGITSPKVAEDEFQLNTVGNTNSAILNEVTADRKFDYNVSLGIRKIARFEYDPKDNVFYDGTESTINSTANVGSLSGLEYNFRSSFIRDEGEKWNDSQYWLRYVGKWFIAKAAYEDNQLVDLKFTNLSLRGKYSIGKFHLSSGISYRTHPVYGFNPIDAWLEKNTWWGPLAYDFGYTDQWWYNDANLNQSYDQGEYSNWNWFDEYGTHVAQTDNEFYKYHYGHLVKRYNEEVLDSLGMQGEISGVLGVDYYTYNEKFWTHSWVSLYALHYGLDDYSFDYKQVDPENPPMLEKIDIDAGLVLGVKLTNKFGFFMEGRYMRFWHIPNFQFKTGINYLIF